MAIYKMVGDKERLDPIHETSFVQERIMEDPDLRYILRSQPEVIEEGLFVLSEEFSGHWRGSGRSIDLLGLDSNGRLVVIELKRTSTADHAELQAIRYAAMVSVLTSEDIVEAHRAYINKWRIEGDAEERIQAHLFGTSFDDIYTESPRIVLVSEGFSKELTTSVLWLNENGLDISCIQLQPYRNERELLIESSQIVPVPGTEDLLVQAQEKRTETREHRSAPSKPVSGGEVFEEHIQDARQEFQQELKTLYNWAVGLEYSELATLVSNAGKSCTTLGVIVSGKASRLTIWNVRSSPYITLDRNVFGELAPNAFYSFDRLLNPENSSQTERGNVTLRSPISEEALAVLTQVYLEANGRLGDDYQAES
ncbi:MAG: endonuclease NucS [Chloroflexi bacterium]|nr:endonuclease NucS [Chloroflexota bacterium]